MNVDQLQQGLEQAFFKEGHKIVFWYDPECDFDSDLSTIELPDVNVVNMNGQSSLGIHLKLELEDTQSKLCVFSSWAQDKRQLIVCCPAYIVI
jgi:hypothetical protein